MNKDNEEWFEAARKAGHSLELYDGEVDIFAYDCGFHNGPRCISCHQSWCMHCEGPKDIGTCDKPAIECVAVEIQPPERRITYGEEGLGKHNTAAEKA